MEVGGGMAGCGIMHGGLVDAAVGWRVGGVGRAEGASVNGWSLGALNAAARWAFRVPAFKKKSKIGHGGCTQN
jgi:hypothetical protein